MNQWDQIRRDLKRADRWESLDAPGRLDWLLNHPGDEFGFYYHEINDVAVRFGHLFSTTRPIRRKAWLRREIVDYGKHRTGVAA